MERNRRNELVELRPIYFMQNVLTSMYIIKEMEGRGEIMVSQSIVGRQDGYITPNHTDNPILDSLSLVHLDPPSLPRPV